jgi:hypothetical protein
MALLADMARKCSIAGVLAVFAVQASAAETKTYPVAGLNPSARPVGAPRVTHAAWDRTRALKGVSAPYPASLNFLRDQGNWHTPFNEPGMTGLYDIRGWHK